MHSAIFSKEAVKEYRLKQLDHQSYSPDLAPNVYFLFTKLKNDLCGKRFNDDDDMKSSNAAFC